MDRSTSSLQRTWVEIYGEDGSHLATIESHIDGLAVTTAYPAFAPGTVGRMNHFRRYKDGRIESWQSGPEPLQTKPVVVVTEIG